MSTNSVNSEQWLNDEQDTDAVLKAELQLTGRNVQVPDHYRVYVTQKLTRLERLDHTIYRFDVELEHERNRRQRKNCQHVEITVRGRGPVIRGEGCANSFYGAFEAAVHKLENRLRRSKDRRTVHYGDKTPLSVHEATAEIPDIDMAAAFEKASAPVMADVVDNYEPGRVVRVKEHPAKPMTVDDALYEMELVGHDFFLFHDKETDRAAVVYRRHAYDYGVIRLA